MQLNRHECQPFLQYTVSKAFYKISATLQLETLWNLALLTRMLFVNSELPLYFVPVSYTSISQVLFNLYHLMTAITEVKTCCTK